MCNWTCKNFGNIASYMTPLFLACRVSRVLSIDVCRKFEFKISKTAAVRSIRSHPYGRIRMDRTGSVLDILNSNLQQTSRTVVPYRYLMRKRGGEREQFLPQKLVLRTGVLSHPVYGWVRTGTDGPYGLSFGYFELKSSTNI